MACCPKCEGDVRIEDNYMVCACERIKLRGSSNEDHHDDSDNISSGNAEVQSTSDSRDSEDESLRC